MRLTTRSPSANEPAEARLVMTESSRSWITAHGSWLCRRMAIIQRWRSTKIGAPLHQRLLSKASGLPAPDRGLEHGLAPRAEAGGAGGLRHAGFGIVEAGILGGHHVRHALRHRLGHAALDQVRLEG